MIPARRWASPSWVQVLVSLCVVGLGVSGARVLDRVEEDLPIAYIEPTLAAADLVHISADVIRYRTTVVIGLEAASEADFARLTAPLPAQRARIESAVDSFASATGRYGRSGLSGQDVQALESNLAAYFEAAGEAVRLMRQVWAADSPEEAAELRHRAELHAADNAGPKLMLVSLALDRLMDQVEQQTGEVWKQGVLAIRGASAGLVLGSLALAALNLYGAAAGHPPSKRAAASPPSILTEGWKVRPEKPTRRLL